MGATLRQVNEALNEHWPELEIELVKGNGYYYVCSDNDETALKLAGLYTTSIGVYSIQHMSIEQWVQSVENVLKDNERISFERTPLI